MTAPFDPARLLTALADHEVDFVLIGGLAGALHGSPAATNDADICPARTPENLVRLAAALVDLDARIRTESEPDGLAFDRSPEFLSVVDLLNATTVAGDLDISFVPTGTDGYDDLAERAVEFDIGDARVRVASLDEVTITRHGRAVAVVVSPQALRSRRADEAFAGADRLRDALRRGRAVDLDEVPTLTRERADDLVDDVRASRSAR